MNTGAFVQRYGQIVVVVAVHKMRSPGRQLARVMDISARGVHEKREMV